MNNNEKLNKLILKSAYITIIILIAVIIALLILKYNVEGEKNMPFKLSNLIVISSAEGHQEQENEKYLWDTEIYQTNDIYISIEKNKNYKETEIIKSISIENIKIDSAPTIGNIKFYKTSNNEKALFTYTEEYEINNNIEYIGDLNTDLSNLKISNQGGTLIIRAVNKTEKQYTSNEKEFEHNGKLLNKVEISNEEIKATISFDLVIKLESDIAFRAQIKLDLPTGDISKEGTSSTEIKENIIFKREQI